MQVETPLKNRPIRLEKELWLEYFQYFYLAPVREGFSSNLINIRFQPTTGFRRMRATARPLASTLKDTLI